MKLLKCIVLIITVSLFVPFLHGDERAEDMRDASPPPETTKPKAAKIEWVDHAPAYEVSQPLHGWKPKGQQKRTTHENRVVSLQILVSMTRDLTQRFKQHEKMVYEKRRFTFNVRRDAKRLASDMDAYQRIAEETHKNLLLSMIDTPAAPDYAAELNATCWVPVISSNCSADGGVYFSQFNVTPRMEMVQDKGYEARERYSVRLPSISVPVQWNVDCRMTVTASASRTRQSKRVSNRNG